MDSRRITAKFKARAVLELLRGGDLEALSRKYAVPASEISSWRDAFIVSGTEGFKHRSAEDKLSRAEREISRLEKEIESIRQKERYSDRTKKSIVEALLKECSGLEKRHGTMSLILKVAGLSSSGWYGKPRVCSTPGKRGRKPQLSDEELSDMIRFVLSDVPLRSEGHRKVHERLKNSGVVASRTRVLRLMRENGFLSSCLLAKIGKRKNNK